MNQLLRIHAIWNPHVYHGWGRSKRFFEVWYYKVVNNSETTAFAIIPGIAMDENGNKHSFIQILDGIKIMAKYHKFDAYEFFGDYDSTAYFSGLWNPKKRAAMFGRYPDIIEIRKHWDIKDMKILVQ